MYIYLYTYLPKSEKVAPTPLGNYNLQTFYIQLLDIKLLRNNRFILDEIVWWSVSKFDIFFPNKKSQVDFFSLHHDHGEKNAKHV